MQQSSRAEYSHALGYAILRANDLGQPLLVVFGLMDDYPEANLRHYRFMLEGLKETKESLAGRGIKMIVRKYFIDGRSPNSFANIAWVFGLHDRPWKERPIFGKIRYMTASGLERKCDISAYIDKVEKLIS